MLTEENVEFAEETLIRLRNQTEGSELTRYAFINSKKNTVSKEVQYVCVASLNSERYLTNENTFLAFAFNGETPKNSRANYQKLVGGEISKAWLEFLMGPDAPFPDIPSYVHNRADLDKINMETGFIFNPDLKNVGSGQLRGFLIASRFAQEQHNVCHNWHTLVTKLGIKPLIAWALSLSWRFDGQWCLTSKQAAFHTVFYSNPGVWLPNLALGRFPNDRIVAVHGGLYDCNMSLQNKEGKAYYLYNNAWGADKEELTKYHELGARAGMNALEAAAAMEETLAIVHKEEHDA